MDPRSYTLSPVFFSSLPRSIELLQEEPAATKSSVNDARDDGAANDEELFFLGDEYDSKDDASDEEEESEIEVDESEEDPEKEQEEPAAMMPGEESISDRNVNVR